MVAGAILGIAGAGFAAYTLDGGFRSMMKEGLVKVSAASEAIHSEKPFREQEGCDSSDL